MKKLIFIPVILLLTFTSVRGQTNVYHPFPDSNANWNFYHAYYCQWDGASILYSIIITGDTLINSTTFHKLYMPRAEYLPGYQCIPADTLSGYKGAIRQDTSLKKVFIIAPFESTEQLLYDFNLNEGDTVKGFLAGYYPNIVESIDSVLVGSNYRKRWFVDHGNNVYIIEGVGSEYGLIRELPGNVLNNFNSLGMDCFVQDGITLYPYSTINCEIIYSSNSFCKSPHVIKISPNPFTQSTQISLNQNYHNITIEVYDIQGKLMMQNEYTDCAKIIFNRNGLNNGMYFFKLTLDGKWAETRKIVVTE